MFKRIVKKIYYSLFKKGLLKKLYKRKTGHQLHLNSPKRFTEKIQWRKVYDTDMVYSRLSDKFAVRDWVAKKIGEEYLIPLLGVWEDAAEIDFNKLPDAFVLKTNNASATNIIVQNKAKINTDEIREKLNKWMHSSYSYHSFEFHYDKITPKIIAEKYMQPDAGETDLKDYKFLCFDGEPKYVWVDLDRYHGHKRKVYSTEWIPESWTLGSHGMYNQDIPKPQRFEEMLELVRVLSNGFAHVRVDLYEIKGHIYFGEMTFTAAGGMYVFSDDSKDYELGDLWDINKEQIDQVKVEA